VTYVLSCTAIMGAIPNEQLIKSAAPFADAAKLALGNTGGAVVSFCAAVGCLGSLGGWILATAQSGKAAADDGLFPRIFGKANHKGVPVAGLIFVAVLMTIAQILTISPTAAKEFGVISSIAVLMTVVAYLYVTGALILYLKQTKNKVLTVAFIAIALAYCSWAVLGSDPKQVAWLAVILLISAALYSWNQVSHNQPPPAAKES